MKINLIYKFSGYLSIVAGIIAAASMYRPALRFYAMGFSILGFILANINIFLNLKYFSNSEPNPKGYLGMFLSSLPVLFVLYMVFKTRH
jgi:hypothetical protein